MKPVISTLYKEEKFFTHIKTETHHFSADEPESAGGEDESPDPVTLALGSLGACTAMTLKIYYDFKETPWEKIEVMITSKVENIDKETASEATKAAAHNGKVRHINKKILITSDMDDKKLERATVIAEKCPVNLMMKNSTIMHTIVERV